MSVPERPVKQALARAGHGRGLPRHYAGALLEELADHVSCRARALEDQGVPPGRAVDIAIVELGDPGDLKRAASSVTKRWAHGAPAFAFSIGPILIYAAVAVVGIPLALETLFGLSRLTEPHAWLAPAIEGHAVLQAILFTVWLAGAAHTHPGTRSFGLVGMLGIAIACGLLNASVTRGDTGSVLRIVFEWQTGVWRSIPVLVVGALLFPPLRGARSEIVEPG